MYLYFVKLLTCKTLFHLIACVKYLNIKSSLFHDSRFQQTTSSTCKGGNWGVWTSLRETSRGLCNTLWLATAINHCEHHEWRKKNRKLLSPCIESRGRLTVITAFTRGMQPDHCYMLDVGGGWRNKDLDLADHPNSPPLSDILLLYSLCILAGQMENGWGNI